MSAHTWLSVLDCRLSVSHFYSLAQQAGALGDNAVACLEARLNDVLLAVVGGIHFDGRGLRLALYDFIYEEAVLKLGGISQGEELGRSDDGVFSPSAPSVPVGASTFCSSSTRLMSDGAMP